MSTFAVDHEPTINLVLQGDQTRARISAVIW